jgi:hypothetical protein
MSNRDRAAILRQNVDALVAGLSELESLRNRVLKAEQRMFGSARPRRRALVKRAVLARR